MIICIKNWDGISQAPALFLRDRSLVAIVRGYISISGHHKGLASPLPHPEGHTQDECEALYKSSRYVPPAISSPWLWPPPGPRSVPGVARPLSGQLWMPCAAPSLLSAGSTTNRTELKTHCRKNVSQHVS